MAMKEDDRESLVIPRSVAREWRGGWYVSLQYRCGVSVWTFRLANPPVLELSLFSFHLPPEMRCLCKYLSPVSVSLD